MKKLPVFFHVPKCGGTYVINRFTAYLSYINKYSNNGRCTIINIVNKKRDILYRLVVEDTYNICSSEKDLKSSNTNKNWPVYDLHVSNLSEELLNNFSIFLVVITSLSFSKYNKQLYSCLPDEMSLVEFIVLREPYDRLNSFISYCESEQSHHENKSQVVRGYDVEKYIKSNLLPACDIIERFIGKKKLRITKKIFKSVCLILDHILVYDIDSIDICIARVLSDCYNVDVNSIDERDLLVEVRDNKNYNRKDFPFNELNYKAQKTFIKRKKWDIKLYRRYIRTTDYPT